MTASRSILITGASSGIGAALAVELSANGRHIFITGRNHERLDSVAHSVSKRGAHVTAETCDVSDQKAIEDFIHKADSVQPLDLVIANAGISSGSAVAPNDIDKARDVFDVNVLGALQTIIPAAHLMAERGHGHLAIVSSIAGFRGLPTAPAYSASKVAINAWGNAVRPLFAKKGLGLSMIYPGFVESRITDQNDFPMPFKMSGEKAAKIIRRGLERRQRSIAFPWQMVIASKLVTALPGPIFDAVMARAPKKN